MLEIHVLQEEIGNEHPSTLKGLGREDCQ